VTVCVTWEDTAANMSDTQLEKRHSQSLWPVLNSTALRAPRHRRIAWLHMPKAGTSLGTALAHLANASLPQHAAMGCRPADQPAGGSRPPNECRFSITEIDFILRYPYDEFFRGVFWTKPSTNFGDHHSLAPNSGWSPDFGIDRVFAMIREPSSRARSAYNHFGRKCHTTFESFERIMRGTAVTMITGQRRSGLHCIACDFPCPPLKPKVSVAITRMHAFAFVGLMEEWALSICLLHTMHGPAFNSTSCSPVEFANSRKGRSHRALHANNATDPFDALLYIAARRRFFSDCARYNVTRESCTRRGCWPSTHST